MVEAARRCLEDVLHPALARPSPRQALQVHRTGQDLSRPPASGDGVLWNRVPRDESLEGFVVAVTDPDAPPGQQDLARISAGLPRPRRRLDGSTHETETTLSFSVRRDALLPGRVTTDIQESCVGWVTATFQALAGVAGYLTLDRVTASPDGRSPYEIATYRIAAERDFPAHVWTHVWGIPLTDNQVVALGGVEALQVSGLPVVQPLQQSGYWIQASHTMEELTRAEIELARRVLAPLLPEGMQTIEEYDEQPALRL